MGKQALFWKMVQDVRASYWFLPSLLVIVGLILARVMLWIDTNPDQLPFTLPATWSDTHPSGARSTLSVIATSIIGVTGVMFSMTLVAVSFASGNFGPRLIGNFMRDRGNQWSLGILISTFVYAVVVLRAVEDGAIENVDQFVPQYALLLALCLTLLCVFTLIFFVHHVPETINVSRISATLGHKLEEMVRDIIDEDHPVTPLSNWPTGTPVCTVTAPRSGYIQTCNTNQLVRLAEDHDWYIEMLPNIGDFVTTRTPVFAIWCNTELSAAQQNIIAGSYAVGTGRTENQNPTFVAEQLVEMAVRALSPGVNDPYTAQDCLNRLAGALTIALSYKGGLVPQPHARARIPQLSFESLFGVTFPLCRQYIIPDNITRVHALALLADLKDVATAADKKIIQGEIDTLRESA